MTRGSCIGSEFGYSHSTVSDANSVKLSVLNIGDTYVQGCEVEHLLMK